MESELIRQVTPAGLDAFARFLRSEERSAGTIENYLRHVRRFAAWLGGAPVTKEAAVRWRDSLAADGYGPGTVNAMVVPLNGFFRFAGWEDCRVKLLRVQRQLFREPARELTRAEYERLLSAAQGADRAQLALLMETICATGIRVSEVRYITVEAAAAGRAVVSLKGKVRTILLPSKLCRKLLKFARQQKTASGEVFLTRNGTGLSRKQIWAQMKALCQTAGVAPSKVFPHNLRHLFARAFYQLSRDVVKLADVLGHSSIETTRIYLVSTGEEHVRQLERLQLVQ